MLLPERTGVVLSTGLSPLTYAIKGIPVIPRISPSLGPLFGGEASGCASLSRLRTFSGGRVAQISREELLAFARHGAVARIAELEAEIASIHSSLPGLAERGAAGATRKQSPAGKTTRRRRRRMSAAARKKISEAMTKRWAKRRGVGRQPSPASKRAGKTPRKRVGKRQRKRGSLSAAGRLAIAEAQKKRWAAIKKAKAAKTD
jgi:hypothetical protein